MMFKRPLGTLLSILVVIITIEEYKYVAGCDMTLKKLAGTFQSPGYPDADDNWTCKWKIVLPKNRKIAVSFHDFDLLDLFFCSDSLQLLDSGTNSGIFTGTALRGKTIMSSGNEFTVLLKTCSPSFFCDRRGINVSYKSVITATAESSLPNTTTESFISFLPLPTSVTSEDSFVILLVFFFAGLLSVVLLMCGTVIFLRKQLHRGLRVHVGDKLHDEKELSLYEVIVAEKMDSANETQSLTTTGSYERHIMNL